MRRQLLISIAAASAAVAFSGIVTASADSLGPFTCAGKAGGISGVPGTVSSIRASHHNGYDRLVIEFAPSAAGAIPAYSLNPQASSTFTRDASGQPVTLDGTAGIKLVLRNTTEGGGAPKDVKPALPAIREVANVGDFERVTSYGIGLSKTACFRALELNGPSRIVVDVQTASDAVQPAAVVSAGTVPTVAPVSQASDTTPSDLATTGHSQAPAHQNSLPLAQITLGLAILTGGLTLGALRVVARR